MSENKTRPNKASVTAFLDSVDDETKRADCYRLLDTMKRITRHEPVMWGPSIIGFGSYHYKYDSGREGDMMLAGFSPRSQNISVYIMDGFDRYSELIQKLGKYKTGKSCLYIKKLSDIDMDVLSALVKSSYEHMIIKYNS